MVHFPSWQILLNFSCKVRRGAGAAARWICFQDTRPTGNREWWGRGRWCCSDTRYTCFFNQVDKGSPTVPDPFSIFKALAGKAGGRLKELSNAHIMKRLKELISNVKAQASRPFLENFLGKLHWFRSQVAKESRYTIETSAKVAAALSGQPASRYNDEGTVETTEFKLYMNVISAQPDERRPEIGRSAIAGMNSCAKWCSRGAYNRKCF